MTHSSLGVRWGGKSLDTRIGYQTSSLCGIRRGGELLDARIGYQHLLLPNLVSELEALPNPITIPLPVLSPHTPLILLVFQIRTAAGLGDVKHEGFPTRSTKFLSYTPFSRATAHRNSTCISHSPNKRDEGYSGSEDLKYYLLLRIAV